MRNDEELMAAYVAGDRGAFNELFDRYAAVLLRVLSRGLRRREEAEDLVQQTFLQLHRARLDFRPGAPLRPWLFTIALNLRREHFRRLQRRPEAPLDLEGPAQPAVDALGHARADAAQTLRVALSQLPPDQAEVIALHWFGGFSFPEIAETVGASLSAVKVRAHRGYVAMREFLEREPKPSSGNSPPGGGISP
jgi:RNA polymerase sigma-70 factor (ECF subfamily)